MKIEVQNEIDAKLLSRKRIMAQTSFEGAIPSRKVIADALASHYSMKPEQIAIKHIYSKPGTQEAKVIAHLYDSEADKKRLEKVIREAAPEAEQKSQ